MKKSPGFTIFELIISIAIFSVVGLGIIMLVSAIFSGSNTQSGLLYENDQARRVVLQFSKDVRNATIGALGNYPVGLSNAQELILYVNVDSDTTIERVRYYLSNGNLYRATLEPSGSPLTYNQANESTQIVQRSVANNAVPLFYYYDGNYDGNSDTFLADPVNPTSVRFIKLNLRVYNRGGKDPTKYYTVSGGATIRNVKDNLAQ